MKNAYYSKWRNAWIEFNTQPTPGQILSMKKYNYRLILDGVETA
jgi:hypothetical protein